MRSVSTAHFRKQKGCPSAEVLLSYGQASLKNGSEHKVAEHLGACDFCAAELRLLVNHPPDEVPSSLEIREMPANLRRLAKALLEGSEFQGIPVSQALFELERLTPADV